jgi:hypothetical protein
MNVYILALLLIPLLSLYSPIKSIPIETENPEEGYFFEGDIAGVVSVFN